MRTIRPAALGFPGLLAVLPVVLAATPAAGQFLDQTQSAGLVMEVTSWGAVLSDLDGDFELDLLIGRHFEDPLLYWNDGFANFDTTLYPQFWFNGDRHGALALSLDNDEDLEIFYSHGAAAGGTPEENELFRNDGPGDFSISIAAAAGLDDPDGRSRAVSAADYDGDYLVDLWVGKAPGQTSKNSLFRNEGSLFFTDVAAAVGLQEEIGTVGGLWGDIDDDGDPDLLVGGEEFNRPTNLFRNDGGSFTDISSVFSPLLPVVSGADFGDMDNDGDLDLVVGGGHLGIFDAFSDGDTLNYFFNTRYGEDGIDGLTTSAPYDTVYARFRTRGLDDSSLVFLGPNELNPDASFPILLTDEYVGAPQIAPGVDRGTWVWRSAPGGRWEIRCSSPTTGFDTFDGWIARNDPFIGTDPHNLEESGFQPNGPRVWRNDGGLFAEITGDLGLPAMLNPRDLSWIDYDNDGDLDLHVVDMGTSADPNAPDGLFRNDGTTFADVTVAEGMSGGTEGLGDGAAWGDTDGDGDLDVYLLQGAGPLAFAQFGPALYLKNAASRGDAILLDVVGSTSGPPAIGTRVTAYIGAETVCRRVSANAWRGFQDPLRVHLGFGHGASVDSLVVEWPTRNAETFLSVPPGTYRLAEDRQFDQVHVLTASPDTIITEATGTLLLETLNASGSRLTRETLNLELRSVAGLLTPISVTENPDTTYSFRYSSYATAGKDTLVVTDLLTNPLQSDSLVVHVLDIITSAGNPPSSLDFSLRGAAPNPFTRSCRIEFHVPGEERANLTIHDVQGRLIRALVRGHAGGRHSLSWDGLDETGRRAPAGVYFVRLQAGRHQAIRKLVRVQ